jgi:hypothetical protein
MNNDGWGQVGAGMSDMRIAGKDLQHNRQTRTADENPTGRERIVRASSGQGGPMKEALDQELNRHRESRIMRLKDLERGYKG